VSLRTGRIGNITPFRTLAPAIRSPVPALTQAAGFIEQARRNGAYPVEINLEATPASRGVDLVSPIRDFIDAS
jgi:hypothetical protein